MRNLGAILSLAILVVVGLVGMNCIFTVHQTKQAIVFQFGEVVRDPIRDPGLKFKMPWQNVEYFDKRVLVHDNPPVTVDVGENERLIVDSFARYRISDPLQFYQTVNSQRVAGERLQTYLDSSVREVIGAVGLKKVVSGERREIMERIGALVQTAADSARLGIQVIDVRIKRADLPQQNMEAVFNRMRTERQKEAQLSRAKGEQRSREIKSGADRTVTVLLANARRRSEEIRGEGDRYRNAIFACAFGADPDFFAFYRSMQAYEKAFSESNTSMVLSPNSDFFRFFGDPKGALKRGPGAVGEDRAASTSSRSNSNDPCGADGVYDLSKIDFLQSAAQIVAQAVEGETIVEGAADAGGRRAAAASAGAIAEGGAWSEYVQAFPVCSADRPAGTL